MRLSTPTRTYLPPNTPVDILREIHKWAEGQDERCILWLNGVAGMGKSTVARIVAWNREEADSIFGEASGMSIVICTCYTSYRSKKNTIHDGCIEPRGCVLATLV